MMGEVPGSYRRVLVIEDDTPYQKLLERYLQRSGAVVGWACDGREGLDKALSGHYDMAFVDVQLPKLDGFMVATLLREQDCQMPLIAMTCLRLEGLDFKARAVGFNDFFFKPITESTIQRLLELYSPVTAKACRDYSSVD